MSKKTAIYHGISNVIDYDKIFSIYPNPTFNDLFLKINSISSNTSLKIYDCLGNEVISIGRIELNSGQNDYKIELEKYNLDNGIYFVHIDAKNINYNSKFIYQKNSEK